MLLAPSLKIFNASAGSGKTYEITFNYIRDIMESDVRDGEGPDTRFYNILAITFTNKAAAEMKSRVLKELFLLTIGCSGMLARLSSELSIDAAEVSLKAGAILSSILHNYSRFSISTIDSFMQRIIRFFARELQMQSDYEVIVEENDLNEFIIENILLKVCSGGELEHYMLGYAVSLFENETKPEKIKEELVRHLGVLVRENPAFISDALLKLDKEKISDFVRKVKSDIQKLSKESEELVTQVKKEILDAGLEEKVYRGQHLGRFLEKLLADPSVVPNSSENRMLEGDPMFINASAVQDEYYRTMLQALIKICRQITDLKLISSNLYLVGLSSAMWTEKSLFMDVENVLPVSEFNEKISKVVKGEAVPFIYLRAGEKFREIMIDEFQDTSVKQWHNLVPLLHETLSKQGRVYLVGDPKQSIYRWRSGQPEIMMQLPSVYQNPGGEYLEAEKTFKNALKELPPMGTNFRSEKNIVEFNNAFFGFVKAEFEKNEAISNDKPNVSQAIADKYFLIYHHYIQMPNTEKAGYVEFRFMKNAEKNNRDDDELVEDGSLYQLCAIIDDAIARGYQQSEIAVIARDKKVLNKVARFLMLQTSYNVMSKETLQLDFSPRCRLIVAVFNYYTLPSDLFVRYELVYILQQQKWFSLSADPVLVESEIAKVLYDQFEISADDFEQFASMNLAMEYLFERLFRRFPDDVFLLFFREEVMNFTRERGFSNSGFRRWWYEKGHAANVVFPEGAEAVSLMTIHKSKGLQFPVVILPHFDFCEESKISRNSKWIMLDNNIDEPGFPILLPMGKRLLDSEFSDIYITEKTDAAMDTLNLMYVALTRAEREMYVLAKEHDLQKLEKDHENVFSENLNASKMLGFFSAQSVFFSGTAIERHSDNNVVEGFSLYSKGVKEVKTNVGSDKTLSVLKTRKHYISLPEVKKDENAGIPLLRSKEKILAGKLIHSLLEEIADERDVDLALHRFESRNYNTIPVGDLEYMLREAITSAGFLFSQDAVVWSERELCDENGKVLRPDRMVRYGDELIIADFKTGVPLEEHKNQLENYRQVAESVGYKVGAVKIVYFHFEEKKVSIVDL